MKKVLNLISNILTVVILIFAVTLTVVVITSARSDDRVPNAFGYALMNVETDSMESENGFFVGDMIVVRMLDQEEANHLKVGDVITFRRQHISGETYLETHRIVAHTFEADVNYKGHEHEIHDGVWVHGGVAYYVTRGDNTQGYDYKFDTGDLEFPCYTNIVGIWTGARIPKLGAALKFMRSQTGFMVCVVIPVALFFIYELYVFIMTLTRKQKEKAIAEVADKEAELKAAAVAEFLAQQQANNGGTTPPAAQTAPAPPVGDGSPVPPQGVPTPPAPAENDQPAPAPAPAPQEPAQPAADAQPAPAAAPNTDDISEEEKQRIIQEYLAKQAQGDNQA